MMCHRGERGSPRTDLVRKRETAITIGSPLAVACRAWSLGATCNDDVHLQLDELGRQGGEPLSIPSDHRQSIDIAAPWRAQFGVL